MTYKLDRKRKPRTELKLRADIAKQLDVSLPDESQRTISPNEAADMLGITGEAVKQWIYHGRLPAVKLGNGYWRIRVSDLTQFLNCKVGSPQHRVLLTPCDKPTLEVVTRIVEELGQTVLVANGEIDAQLKLRNECPSVLILDLSHPSGWALFEKASANTLRGLLLIVDQSLNESQIQRITRSSAKAILDKPIDEAIIKRELQRAFGQ